MTFFKMRNLLCWTHKRPIVRPTWLSLRFQVALGEMCFAGLAAAVLVVVGSVRLDNPNGDPPSREASRQEVLLDYPPSLSSNSNKLW